MATLALALLGLVSGCEAGSAVTATRSFTSTVTVGRAVRIAVDSALPLEIVGHPAQRDILAQVDLAVTASTSSKAQALVASITLLDTKPDGDTVLLTLPAPEGVALAGSLRLVAPPYLRVEGVVRSGVTRVAAMGSAITLESRSDVTVEGAEGRVSVRVSGSGTVRVDSRLPPDTGLIVQVGSGDVELALPGTPSAAADLTTRSGQVLISHPAFQQPFGPARTHYTATVNGGLSPVQVLTGAGTILIRARSGP